MAPCKKTENYTISYSLKVVIYHNNHLIQKKRRKKGGHYDHMVVGFLTTYVISASHHLCCEFESRSGEVYSIQCYVIKFVSDVWQVGGFLHQ
jgi:hypothetical protein